MKKTLVALAALAATSAFAQNAVSLYGLLDLGYSNAKYELNDALQVARKGFATNSDNSSRWGLTGTEDLGGGLKAEFKIESGIGTNPRSGIAKNLASINGTSAGNAYTLDNTVLGDRELWIGATNASTGTTIKAGYGVTELRNLAVATDAAGTNAMGNPIAHDLGVYRREGAQVLQAFGATTVSAAVFGNRQTQSPTTAGVADGNYKMGRGYQAAVVYAQGPIRVGFAHDEIDQQNPEVAATSDIKALYQTSKIAAVNTTSKTNLVAGSYDFGKAKVFAQYYNIEAIDNTSSAIAAGEGKKKAYSVGVRAPFGAAEPFAQVFKGTNSQSAKATYAGEDRAWTGYSVGARYNLSKRTYAYAVTGQYKTAEGSDKTNYGDKTLYKQSAVGLAHAF